MSYGKRHETAGFEWEFNFNINVNVNITHYSFSSLLLSLHQPL
jgi:hypothetical protein